MFDWVNVVIPCPFCGGEVADFQSKDSYCVGEKIEPESVSRFYSSCPKCKAWVEYERDEPQRLLANTEPAGLTTVLGLGFRSASRAKF